MQRTLLETPKYHTLEVAGGDPEVDPHFHVDGEVQVDEDVAGPEA